MEYYLVFFFFLFFCFTMYLPRQRMINATGTNPVVVPKDDTAQGFIGKTFALLTCFVLLVLIIYAFIPAWKVYLLPAHYLETPIVKWIGLTLLHVSLIIIIIAQKQMQHSWRVGFDTTEKTLLVTNGLFKYSRNPIFVGMIMTLCGLFMSLPNALSFTSFILIFTTLQIQVRMEEEYLRGIHGVEFEDYMKKTKRWF